MKKLLLSLSVAGMLLASCSSGDLKLREDNIDEIISAMTLEEKAQLIIGVGMAGVDLDRPVVGSTDSGKVPGAAGYTAAIERLGIPAIALCDGPAGLRIQPKRENDNATYYCTHFPIGTLLASTWDQELVEKVGEAMGNEVLEYGADVLLAPALNIHRNPLCGRNFEYYSEDPIVSGKIAAAYVKGIQSNGVGTSIKHFAFNNQETNRMGDNSIISTRAIREIYLKGFEIAVKESAPWTVMSSYNYINGDYDSESVDLLTNILRDDWKYAGTVMTDWFGGTDGARQVHAGNDMLQPGRQGQYQSIIDGVNNGTLDIAEVDRNVKRILQLVVKSPTFKGYKYTNKPDLTAHAEITRKSATEGMVLLENKDAALPLKDVKKIALFGITAYNWIAGGTGSGDVNRAYTVSLLDGLKNAGFETNPDLQKAYLAWNEQEQKRLDAARPEGLAGLMFTEVAKELDVNTVDYKAAIADADVALITIGRISGEGGDRKVEDFELNATEKALIQKITSAAHAAGKKAIVVLNIGGVIETASWKNIPDAILCAWQGGQEGGNSVADVLSGKANPSGKLTMTWPVNFKDHKSSENFPINVDAPMAMGKNPIEGKTPETEGAIKNVDYTIYEEGIYVGYRWFDTQKMAVSYPFGYGKSYTTFEYSNPAVTTEGDKLIVTVDVKNTGTVEGKEIAQVYVTAPASSLDKPAQELKSFAKTKSLKPGESQSLKMEIKTTDLASFDEAQNAWVVDAGEYIIKIGASSRDIKAELKANVAASTSNVSKAFIAQK